MQLLLESEDPGGPQETPGGAPECLIGLAFVRYIDKNVYHKCRGCLAEGELELRGNPNMESETRRTMPLEIYDYNNITKSPKRLLKSEELLGS